MSWFRNLFGNSKSAVGKSKDFQPEFKLVVPEYEVPDYKEEKFDPARIERAIESFPYEIIETTGEAGFDKWQALCTQHAGKLTPFILGGEENLIRWCEEFEHTPILTPEDALLKSMSGKGFEELLKWNQNESEGANYSFSELLEDITSRWDDEEPKASKEATISVTHHVLTQKPHSRLFVTLLPTPNSYEAPAYLRMGGWNEMPSSDWLCAAFRRWHKVHQVVIIGGQYDYLECLVKSPPKTSRDAAQLAAEQFILCEDLVSQGAGDPMLLATSLQDARMWGFWWD